MSDKTTIEWTEATWNPLVGCTKVSPGCDHCYAETLVNRFAGTNTAFPSRFDVVTMRDDRMLLQPLRWTRPRRIFVNSLSDLFHADVPEAFIARVFAVMSAASQHTFQLLTKRHARMRSLLSSKDFVDAVADALLALDLADEVPHSDLREMWWPLPNVWLGVSVEDQKWADTRIPALLTTPAAVRWISAEPLLGPICLCDYLRTDRGVETRGIRLDWVVTGGESGPGARPMDPRWAIDIAEDCQDHDVAFLHKQNGCYLPDPAGSSRAVDTAGREYPGRLRHVGKKAAGRLLDGRTYDGYPIPPTLSKEAV